jgi:type I restriction enzyme, S subunit
MSGLPKGWFEARLASIFDMYQPETIAKSDLKSDGPYPVYGANGVIGRYDRYNHEEAQLLVTCRGATCGAVNVTAPKSWINGNAMVVRPLEGVMELRWAEYYFRGVADYSKIITGTAQPQITRQNLDPVLFPLPPLAEQKRIVAKLDARKAKSARARTELARIETLVSRYKQAVLSKAFSGELTASQRLVPMSRVVVREMLSELAQGWSPKCEKISASSDEQWAVITTTAIQSFSFQPNENKILPADLSPRPHLVIEEGDVLITRAGPRVRCGVCCYVERTRPKLMLCDKAYRLRLKDLFDPEFFVFLMNSPELLSRIEDMKTGGNDSGLNLTQERFTSLVVPMWPLDVQQEIVRRIESAFAQIDRLAKEAKRALELMGRLDEAILAKAFRGELVPQDENDEPAEHLLARIRAERETVPKGKRGRVKA